MTAKNTWLIGSRPDCDLVVDDPHVSGRHCQLTRTPQGFQLVDLSSTNGTYVNGARLVAAAIVRPSDQITLGYSAPMPWPPQAAGAATRHTAVEQIPQIHPAAATRAGRGIRIEARQITVDVPGRRLLENVSLTIEPGEFVGLMGPSGAGKTTLMSALNGYSPPSGGQVLVDGQDLYEHYAQYADQLGYVPQDDIMHRELTVGQALYYTARLRLPPDTTDEEIHHRIASVLKQLGLEGTIHTLVGSPERKGISGGQRKRVNLAMELLTDPAVLFLDEPTSGLSSEDALTVMTLLRKLADSGKSILLTVHQPSLEAYRLLDNVVIISKDAQSTEPGRLAYYGPAYPDAVQFFNPRLAQAPAGTEPSPDELLRGLARQPTLHWRERYEQSAYQKKFITARANQPAPAEQHPPTAPQRVSILQQWGTLVRRALVIKAADRWNTLILLAQAPVVALALVLVFGSEASHKITAENWETVNNATGVTVFLLGLSALWFGCSNSVREIVGEWAIYQRERMVNLRLPSYVFSKFAVSTLLCVVQCAILIGAARWGNHLQGPIFSSFLMMLLVACTGIGIGLILSAVARTSEVAIAMLPLTLIPMVIFGGILLPVYKMHPPIKVLAYAMPTRSGFEAMMLAESSRKPLGPSPYSGAIESNTDEDDPDRPDMAELYFPRHVRLGIGASLAILAGMLLTALVAIHVILRARDVR